MKRFLFRNKLTIVLFFVFVILILLANLFCGKVRNFFYSFSNPIQGSLWEAGGKSANFLAGIWQVENIKSELNRLEGKSDELDVKNVALNNLEQENKFLREALNLGLEKKYGLILGRIISKNLSEDSVIINKGSKDGISLGDSVISQQEIVAGKVSEVFENYSKVTLLSNKNFLFDIKIQHVDKSVFAAARGGGNFRIFLDYISQEEIISEGDLVLTNCAGSIFPNNLLIGKVGKIIKNDLETFQKAEIEPAFDLKEVENIFIIQKFQ
jgi:rod shape-determining protein MreC